MSPRYTADPAFRYRMTWTYSHEWPQDALPEPTEPLTFGHVLAVVSGGVITGIVGWLVVTGLLVVAS